MSRLGSLIGVAMSLPASCLQAQAFPDKSVLVYECQVASSLDPHREEFRLELSPAGDFDGDGHDDLLVAMFQQTTLENWWLRHRWFCEIEVRSGRDGSRLWGWPGAGNPAQECVLAAAAGGDVNADGKSDLIVTVVSAIETTQPLVRIVLGGDGQALRAFQADFANEMWNPRFGNQVGSAGDVDADGFGDYFVTTPEQWVGGPGNAGLPELLGEPYRQAGGNGALDVYSGKTGERLWRQSQINADNGFAYSAASVGYVNSDYAPDLVVGAPPSIIGHILQPVITDGGFFTLSGSDGAVLSYRPGRWDEDGLGYAVIPVGDVDGDHAADVAVGAGSRWTDSIENAINDVAIASAKDGEILRTLDRSLLGIGCASTVRSAGDINGDRRLELVVGPRRDESRRDAECLRELHVVDPRSGLSIAQLHGAPDAVDFGCAAGSAGDADGDGRGDLAVCASLVEEGDSAVALIRIYKFDD